VGCGDGCDGSDNGVGIDCDSVSCCRPESI
jgi:hypothetical protein